MNTAPFPRRAFVGVGLAVLVVLGISGGFAAYRGGFSDADAPGLDDDPEGGDARPVAVKVIQPKLNDRDLLHTVTQPAFVQGFYKADVMARVAGAVKAVNGNIGDRVKAGDVLIELDVPDLVQEVAHKEAMVKLAGQEALAAEKAVKSVNAAMKEATALLREKQVDVDRHRAKQKYHLARYNRIRKLADADAVESGLVDEYVKNLEASEADYKSALVAVDSARANLEEFEAKLDSARQDVEVKKAREAVARADRDKARAMADYLKIRAPFDGIIASRRVDPGSFVQNASTGSPTPLLTLQRTDKVTLVMWVPEREVPYVSRDTEAVIRLDALRGKEVRSRVTRLSHFLDPEKSRDMRIEVDVDNADGRLCVGMYGSMTLTLERFERAYVLPSSAVFVRNNRPCICEVRDGKAHLVPVVIQQEDGIRVKVARLVTRRDPKTGRDAEAAVDLTGSEVIVRSGQGEIRDGQELRVSAVKW